MASRRPSSRPTPRRRSSGAEGARTTREINAEKSRQRRAAKAAKKDEATVRGVHTSRSADRVKATASSATGHGHARVREAANKRREKGTALSIGGLDISTRLVVVLTVAAILAVMLVPNVYQWWQQERELAQIKAQVAEQQRKNADMQRQLDLWNDPDYISTQARERLGYVRPGETQYTVVDPGPQYQDSAMAAAATPSGPARPWVQQLAILVGKADQPPHATPIPSAETSQSDQDSSTGQESGE
ncbi:septum formation initiator family protein [Actinomyces bouchesdurhonensis]|uniref:FtsB family cell division protein n=1 Tax=Actinomyces bouchesdurhonensis TaxID=1852361 RepID=UPI0028E8E882|nr:septum formation initiator family protein [Actinomyces bouchesdurhonensis]